MAKEKKHSKGRSKERADDRPGPPFPPQHQERPGLEKKMAPQPEFEGEKYKAAGKLEGKVALVTGGDSGIGRAVSYLFAREGADIAIVYLEEEQPDAVTVRDEIRREAHEGGRRDHQLRLDHRSRRQQGAARLRVHQRRDSCVHEIARAEPGRSRHSCELRLARPVWTPLNVVDKPAEEAGKHGQDTPMGRPAQPDEVAPAFVCLASEADSSYITGELRTLLGGETTAA